MVRKMNKGKTNKVLSLILAILMIFTSVQFTMGTKAEAAAPDSFDTATGTLTLNGTFVAGVLKTQIDNLFNTLTPKPAYSEIKVLIITAGVVGVGKSADGNDTTAPGIIPSLTGLVDFQLIGTATTQSGQNVNTKNTTPTNLFTSVNNNLKSVKLDNVTTLSSSTFTGIASLTTLVIPKVTSLSPSAYPNCPNLTSITSGVVVAPPPTGDAVITFDGTNNSKALLDLLAEAGYDSTDPAKAALLKTLVIKSSSGAKKVFANSDFNPTTGKSFSNYKNLTSFTIEKPIDPTFLTWSGNKLPNNAFKGLTSLKTVKIGIDTSYIGSSAFQGDILLETAEFGLTRTLGPLAFSGDISLKSITFNKTYLPIGLDDLVGPPPAPGDWFYGVDTDHLIIRVPTVSVDLFINDGDWSGIGDNGVIVMSNGDDAEQDAGSGPAATQTVTINTYFAPKSLKSAIDSSNFTGTNYGDIRVLTINAGELDPTDCAFIASNLTKLEELYVVGTANFVAATIPKNAFEGNRYLKKVQADNVTTIGVKAFNLFENLTEVNFPNVTTISSQAFAQTKGSSASKLTTARFPKVKKIEQRAFYFCMNLTDLYLGDVPPELNVPDGKQGLWFNFVTHMTIHVPSLAVYNEYIKLENSDQIDWSAMTFVADNGDSLPVITPAAPYIDADYNFLRVDQTVPYYNGDYKLSLNMYTFNSNINSFLQGRTSPTPMTALEAIQWAHDHGFDAVDVTCYYIPGYSNTAMPTEAQIPAILAYAKQIKDLASSLGIAISGTGIQNNFADPNQTRRDLDIMRINFWTQVASEMGAPVIRVFSGPPPVDIARTGWATITHDRIVPAIQQVADYAAANYPDVQIGVQNHGDMLATANQVLQLVQWINRSNVGIVNDTGYYRDFLNVDASQYDWYKDISLVLPYSNNFQVKKKPGGAETTELMDLNKLFGVIRNSPYRGYIPVELLWLPGDDGYPNVLSTPPYDETSRFLQSMKTAMADTKHAPFPDLSNISLSSGALNETFARAKQSYTQNVANNILSLTLTPTVVDAEESVTVNGTTVISGQPSKAIALNVGENIITVVVTAQNGTPKTYTVTVTRASAPTTPPSNGNGGGGDTSDTVISTDGNLTLPTGKIGEVSLGDGIKISIPADASGKELKLTIEKVLDTQKLLTEKDVLASPIYEILKNFSENFSKPVTLSFAFDPASLKSNKKVAVFYYDEVKKTWVEVAGSKVNGNHVTVEVNHFTKYAVFAIDQAAEKPTTDNPTDTKPPIQLSDIVGHWAEVNIKQAVSKGIVSGYPDGTFKPNHTVTRAEFAVMLMNTLKPQGEGVALSFTDTAKIGSWALKAITQAVQAGIIHGYEDGSFRPDAEITRAEVATMLANAMGLAVDAESTTDFTDDNDVPAWSKGAVAAMKKQGLIEGKGANQFAPTDSTTRAEAVTVLLRLANKSN
ncbi:S-layer homology domain-containing protein [Paenibacillus sp. 2RAB27]|uniref:S-layer homology domain-containing protein n=1 Tax=Paenibacillus sp. 2RAB27 TaxID=3232991 RepID=UPI003F9AA730